MAYMDLEGNKPVAAVEIRGLEILPLCLVGAGFQLQRQS